MYRDLLEEDPDALKRRVRRARNPLIAVGARRDRSWSVARSPVLSRSYPLMMLSANVDKPLRNCPTMPMPSRVTPAAWVGSL